MDWRGTQVVRERSAKPLYVGSIPTRASKSTQPTWFAVLQTHIPFQVYIPVPGYRIHQPNIRILPYCHKPRRVLTGLVNGREWSVKSMAPASMRLRLEPADGSPVKEYRIMDGSVEVRMLAPKGGPDTRAESAWLRLTPDQLSIHVERNTVVAQWLECRLGWRRLLQACVSQESSMWEVAEDTNRPSL